MNKHDALKKLNQLFFGDASSPSTVRDKEKKLVLFIHGWSGSDDYKTWGNFLTLFDQDLHLREIYDCETYKYKAPKISLEWLNKLLGKKTPDIQELADGLRTALDIKYKDYHSITLFCHSLGGLIAMRYLISLRKNNINHKIERLVLFATPIQGSDLANTTQFLSGQIKQVCKRSDFLYSLNEDWLTLGMSDDIDTHYCIGDQDGVVDYSHVKQKYDQTKIKFRTIPNCDHRSVVKPEHATDLSYAILRDILII